MISLKRVYEKPHNDDGFRILVDRLWPRGLSKQKAHVDLWFKDIAPSTELRTWFTHDPAKWQRFVKLYRKELAKNKEATGNLQLILKGHAKATLLYGAHDEEHNHAIVLKKFLETGK